MKLSTLGRWGGSAGDGLPAGRCECLLVTFYVVSRCWGGGMWIVGVSRFNPAVWLNCYWQHFLLHSGLRGMDVNWFWYDYRLVKWGIFVVTRWNSPRWEVGREIWRWCAGMIWFEEEDVVSGARDGLLAAEPLTEHWTHLCFISHHSSSRYLCPILQQAMTWYGYWLLELLPVSIT